MKDKIDITVKYVVAVFWILFDAIVLTAKFVACIAIVIMYMLLAFVIAFVVVWIMEIKVRH